jgi:hypothetical protein
VRIWAWKRSGNGPVVSSHAAVILALYSIVALTATHLMSQDSVMVRHAAWYAKDSPTFSDAIALVRRSLWGEEITAGQAIGATWQPSGRVMDLSIVTSWMLAQLAKEGCLYQDDVVDYREAVHLRVP